MASKFCQQVFSVTQRAPELIVPATPTPREVKHLSDIDDQETLRFQLPMIFFYKNEDPSSTNYNSMKGKDPVKVIREAISKALVFYYPLAGRLIEGHNRKLMVDCNGEGVLFIEADANFTLEQLGDDIQPPCPYLDQLLYHVPGSEGIIGCPLLLFQEATNKQLQITHHQSLAKMASKISQKVFSVTQQAPELIVPATPTPREVKHLSDIDDQESLRFHVPLIFFYKNDDPSAPTHSSMKGKDPVKVIREAISKALVFYYPLAGRLIEGHNRKLMVDCNGEGVLFIEADANFTLEQLGDDIQPPCPYLDQLLYHVPGSEGIIGCPLLLFQVTRLLCGGFTFAFRFNHTLCDAPGLVQFLTTIQEMARGKQSPSLFPIWQRQILNARNPPRVTCTHHEYCYSENEPRTLITSNPSDNMAHKSFFFGPTEIKSLRNQLPRHLKNCSTFDLVAACTWKCRTLALQLDPEEIVTFSCTVKVRGKHYDNMNIPSGYYGNAFAFPAVCSKAKLLSENSLGFAVELVKMAKGKMNEEYIRSVADLMVISERRIRSPTKLQQYLVSDIRNMGFSEIDLMGRGTPVYGGTAGAAGFISFFMKYQNYKNGGETGSVVPICLPDQLAMERFEEELKRMNIQGFISSKI